VAEPQAHRADVEKRMSRAELIFPAIIFATVAAFAAGGYFIGGYPWGVLAFPLGAAVLTCVLCAIEIARVLAARRQPASAPAESAEDALPMSASGLAWMFVLPVFLYGLGFIAGTAAYLLACLRANGFTWRLSAGVALVSLAVTWGLFVHVMGVLLPIMPLWWP
jgi:Tripartite tricarboxylate transporter TctB family